MRVDYIYSQKLVVSRCHVKRKGETMSRQIESIITMEVVKRMRNNCQKPP